MKKLLFAAIIAAVMAFGAEYKISNPANPSEIIAKIQKEGHLKKPKPKPGMLKAYSIATYDLNFDTSRDLLTSIGDASGTHLFYLISNITQNDPTLLSFNVNQAAAIREDYRNDYNGTLPTDANFTAFYTQVQFATNTIGGWFKFTSYPSNNLTLMEKTNIKRGEIVPLMWGKPFFKVYVDTSGYLNAQFTLITGGTEIAKTSQPIPLNTKVYLQANNNGTSYEVGWKTADGQSSTGSAAHQGPSIPADISEHVYGRNTCGICGSDFNATEFNNIEMKDENGNCEHSMIVKAGCIITNLGLISDSYYENLASAYNMTSFFWAPYETLFSSMNSTDLSDKLYYQVGGVNVPLTIDAAFVNRVVNDILGNTNNFSANGLRLFVDTSGNVIAADVREIY